MTEEQVKQPVSEETPISIRSRYFFTSYVVSEKDSPFLKFNQTFFMSYAGHFPHIGELVSKIKELESAEIENEKSPITKESLLISILNIQELSQQDYDDAITAKKTLISLLPVANVNPIADTIKNPVEPLK